MNLNYTPLTTPTPHQQRILNETAHKQYFALFWEMGCGKTKTMIDNIAYLYQQKEINGALIIAPNGVDLNWFSDEIPKHLPTAIKQNSRIFRFTTKKSGTKHHKEQVKWLIDESQTRLSWLIMSYDAIMTPLGKEAALTFLEKRQCFYVLDESACIKTPGAKRTMRITRTAYRAKYRRILDGYPAPNGAFDLYSQIDFLDSSFWAKHGHSSPAAFRSYFGVFEQKHNHKTHHDYNLLLGYQHLDELKALIAPISSRLLKSDVLNLPPKIYLPRYFELSPEQRKLYDELKENFLIWLNTDTLVTASLAITRLLRLQQISCGYLPTPITNDNTPDQHEPLYTIPGPNPRLSLLESLLANDATGKSIIWCRYRLDIKLIQKLLTENNYNFVTYTGETDDADRTTAKLNFQNPTSNTQFFLATPSAAGIGLTLHAAHNVFYYSNSFNLRERKQSEDRAHRQGLTHSVNYIDLLGNNTTDKQIMKNLTTKMSVSDTILGDNASTGHDIRGQLKHWLEQNDE